MRHLYWFTRLALVLACLVPSLVHAQFVDNKGTDFYMGFMPNEAGLGSPSVEIHLTADVATDVTVQYPVNAPTFDTTVPVTPGDITVVIVPISAANGWGVGIAQENVVRAFGPDEFVAYMINRAPFSSDAALALPVEALNTDYRVFSYTPQFVGSQFVVAAAFDNTTITITPKAPLRSGQPAGAPFNITLDRGEGWYGLSVGTSGAGNDLTGSLIESDKPIALTNGDGCTQVPPGTTACDHIFEVAQPLASWGNEVIVSPIPNRPFGSVYRVLASEDNTVVTLDGGAFAVLDAGEFFDTAPIPDAHVFSADKPIFVAQFMTGVTGSGSSVGDPAMGNMVPSEQYLSAYTFSTVGGGQFVDHFLSVIAENDDVTNGTILFDGVPIPAASFASISGTAFSYAQVEIAEGTHSTQSLGLHGITVEGYNSADSYIFPGGARFQFINQGEDETSPLCAGVLNGTTFNGTATDLLADDPENRGIFFVALGAGSTNLTLAVDPFTPGDESVSYAVTLTDPTASGSGSVVVTDGAGNTCASPVTITVDAEVAGCTPESFLYFSDWDLAPSGDARGEFTELTNDAGNGTEYDLSGCDYIVFDPFSENVTYATDAAGTVGDGGTYSFANVVVGNGQMTPAGTLPDAPSVFALVQGSVSAGQSVETVLSNTEVVAAVVVDRDGTVYGSVRGGSGQNQNQVQQELLNALARLYAVADEEGGALDLSVQAAPNPASGQGAVSFGLADGGDVTVALYDALGRQVALLAEGSYGPGRHRVDFDASALPAGVYVVRVLGGADARAARLTVAR